MVSTFKIDGASSGLDFTAVIDALTAIQRKTVKILEGRVDLQTARQTALMDLSASILGLQTAAAPLSTPEFFMSSGASSGNPSVLLATSNLAVPGSYLFEVARLAQAQQLRSGGFASATTPVGSGELAIEIGSQGLTRNTPLDSLRDGAGVDRGTIVLRQTVGASTTTATVDLRAAVGVQDVVDALNASGMPVTARVDGDRVSLSYTGAGTLEILNGAGDTTASDLGLAGAPLAAGETRFGANVNFITASTLLSKLNDGAGVRGAAGADFTITDTAGTAHAVDLAGATTVGDAIAAINTATGGAVTASINAEGNAIELTDSAGGAGNLAVSAAGASNAALDLGLLAPSELAGDPSAAAGRNFVAGNRVTPDLNGLLARTLNGGSSLFYPDGSVPSATDLQGVASGSISVTDTLGATTTVDLSARKRSDVLAVVSPDTLTIDDASDIQVGQTIRLADGGANQYATVASKSDLGGGVFDVTFTAPVSVGAGGGAFRSRETLASLMTEINRAGAGSFQAVLNGAGNGIELIDLAGGAGAIEVAEAGSTTARDLGLVNSALASGVGASTLASADFVGLDSRTFVNETVTVTTGAGAGFTATVSSFDSSTGTLTLSGDPAAAGVLAGDAFRVSASPARAGGADADAALLTDNTALSTLNGGQGVQKGKIRVTDRSGVSFTVDLTQADDDTVFDVVDEINAAASSAGSSLRARINDAGDGIQLSQAAGAGSIRVDEVSGGRTARDLRLLGTAPVSSPGLVDGTFEVRVAIASGDTLNAVVTRVNALGIPVSASAVNDGSTTAPFRLSLISTQSGSRGRVVVDTSVGSLQMTTTAAAQDALVLSGSGAGAALIQSPTNTVNNAVSGLTLDLRGTGGPVAVTVTPDTGAVKEAISGLVEAFNAAAEKIDQLGAFDTETNQRSILFGEPALRTSERRLFDLFTSAVSGLPSGTIRDFGTLGVEMGQDGRLFVNEAKLDAALATSPGQVRDFFTAGRTLKLDTKLADFRNGLGIDTASGGDDLKITQHDGTTVSVSLGGVKSVSQLLDRINTDPENTGDLVAAISPDGRSLQLTDSSAGAASFRVEPVGSSAAASQLGLQKAVDGASTLVGAPIDLSRDPGAARRALEQLTALTDGPDGLIPGRIESIDRSITRLRDSIESAESRIQKTIDRLTRRFAALEEFLSATNGTLGLLQGTLVPFAASLGSKKS